jgi:hypothetical protein
VVYIGMGVALRSVVHCWRFGSCIFSDPERLFVGVTFSPRRSEEVTCALEFTVPSRDIFNSSC